MNEKYELIKFIDNDFSLDVSVSPKEETVWLTQKQMSLLFNVSTDNIGLHIKNILKESELDNSVSEESSVTASDGKMYKTKIYNLDMIISVGYRVKSKRGITFRKWANSVLKSYLINGLSINENRCLSCQENILNLETKYQNIEDQLNDMKQIIYDENYKIIFEGEIVEPYSFIRKIFFLAKKELIIIDCYADNFLLDMLKDINVKTTIITSSKSSLKYSEKVKIIKSELYHDRYIIADDYVYNIGTSFNEIGKKRFTISKLHEMKKETILKDIKIG